MKTINSHIIFKSPIDGLQPIYRDTDNNAAMYNCLSTNQQELEFLPPILRRWRHIKSCYANMREFLEHSLCETKIMRLGSFHVSLQLNDLKKRQFQPEKLNSRTTVAWIPSIPQWWSIRTRKFAPSIFCACIPAWEAIEKQNKFVSFKVCFLKHSTCEIQVENCLLLVTSVFFFTSRTVATIWNIRQF